jgi:hypothetical protein
MPHRKAAKAIKRHSKTVHAYVEGLLARSSKPYAEIAAKARTEFHSETSPASVRHYASKMRREGRTVRERPMSREAAFA